MPVLDNIVRLGSKLSGMREWRHTFPIVLALFCSGLSGLMALVFAAMTCIDVSVSALMTCVGMVAFSSVLMCFPKRRRFYALADRLKLVAEAATRLHLKDARRVAESEDWHPFLPQVWSIKAELHAVELRVPPVRAEVTNEVMHMPWNEFVVWGKLLEELSVYARERRYTSAVEACRRASAEFEARTGEPADLA